MDIQQVIGAVFLITGLVSMIGYITRNEGFFSKKQAFVKRWGERTGTTLHFAFYVVTPIVLGAAYLLDL